MTLTLARYDSTSPDPAPDAFIDRFAAAGARIQALRSDGAVEPAGYLTAVLSVGLQRPGALLIVDGPDGCAVARAGVFQGTVRASAAVIGLYEAAPGVEGEQGAEMLTTAAIEWAASRNVLELFAPVDVNTWFQYRFVRPSQADLGTPREFRWEPSAPAEYRQHFLDRGFHVAASYESVGFDIPDAGQYKYGDLLARTRSAHESATQSGFRMQRIGSPDLAGIMTELHALCADAFRGNLLFEPVSFEVFSTLYGGALAGSPGHFTFIARDRAERLVGFVFTFPDRGWIVIKTIAVAPDLRSRRMASALMYQVYREAGRAGFRRYITALVREDNASRFLLDPEAMPGVQTWTRRYDLLRRPVASGASGP